MSVTVNCIEEELPHRLCSAQRVEVLSLNGLRAAEGCPGTVEVPLVGVALFNTIGGTVPSCVWALRNLSVLHLTGNGLTGELVPSLPAFSQMADLSLSHNRLSGTIPLDFLRIASLDLSYNELAGDYADRSQAVLDSTLNLEVNRLSGQLPVAGLENVGNGSVNVLRGNLFSCNSIPESDAYSRDYVCGSRNLNDSLYVSLSAAGLVLLVAMLVCWGRSASANDSHHQSGSHNMCLSALRSRCELVWTYMAYLHSLNPRRWSNVYSPALLKIAKLSGAFVEVMRSAAQLLGVVLAGSVVLYLVKAMDSSGAYATHSETYAWFWTLAYMHGVVPAGLLLLMWTGAISACFYRVVVCPAARGRIVKRDVKRDDSIAEAEPGVVEETEKEDTSFRGHALPFAAALIFNSCVTITVNALYIYSTQQALGASVHFGLQLGLSTFRLLYSVIALPTLSRYVRSAGANIRLRFKLLLVNNLLIPCLVTALTSDSCFQVPWLFFFCCLFL